MDMYLKLDCGRSVSVDSLYATNTYAGLLEGRPNARMNEKIIQRVHTEMEPLWGKRPTYVIPPEIDSADPAHPRLPPCQLTAWLHCYTPIQEPNAGSQLVVVWFRAKYVGASLDQVVYDAIRGLQWDELAKDFEGY